MNDQELSHVREILGHEVRSILANEMQEIRLLKESLDSLLEHQKQRIEDLDVLIVGFDHEQKKTLQEHLDSLKKSLAEQKKLVEDSKALYQTQSNDFQELRSISSRHQQKLSSYYDYLYLKVFGIAAFGGLFALLTFGVIVKFVLPFIREIF